MSDLNVVYGPGMDHESMGRPGALSDRPAFEMGNTDGLALKTGNVFASHFTQNIFQFCGTPVLVFR